MRFKQYITTVTLSVAVAGLSVSMSPVSAQESVQEWQPNEIPVQVAVVTGMHPYDEATFMGMWDAIPGMEYVHKDLPENGPNFDNLADWEDFDVIILYNVNQNMNDEQFKNFTTLLKNGVGLIPMHHGLLSWSLRPEIKEIYGIDFPLAGEYGYHLDQDFWVHIADETHPITKGMVGFMLHDETYTNCYGDGQPGNRVLVTTGHEPSDDALIWVREENDMRVCGIQGGHDHRVFNNPEYRELMGRSIFWAANRSDDYQYLKVSEVVERLKTWKPEDGMRLYRDVEYMLYSAGNDPHFEGYASKLFCDLIDSPEVSREAKDVSFRVLTHFASHENLEFAGKYLNDDTFSSWARAVLEACDFDYREEILLNALKETQGKNQIGIIDSLARIDCQDAIKPLYKIAKDSDQETATAAIDALGYLGTKKADKYLEKLVNKLDGDLKERACLGRLYCADALLDSDKLEDASQIYEELREDASSQLVQGGVLKGLVLTDHEDAPELIQAGLLSGEVADSDAAMAALMKMDPAAGISIAQSVYAEASPITQVALATYAGMQQSAEAVALALKAARSEDPVIAVAGLDSLVKIGDASCVAPLLSLMETNEGSVEEKARFALERMPDVAVDEQLKSIALDQNSSSASRSESYKIMADRRTDGLMPLLFDAAGEQDREVRKAAWVGIEEIATLQDMDELLVKLLEVEKASERRSIRKVIVSASVDGDPVRLFEKYTATWEKGNPETREALAGIIASLGTEQALAFLTGQMDTGKSLRTEIIRALGEWKNDLPADTLYDVASNDEVKKNQVLALRGYLQVIGIPSQRSDQETYTLYAKVADQVSRPDEKRALLSGMAKLQVVDAYESIKSYLQDTDVQTEAVLALTEIAPKMATVLEPADVLEVLNSASDLGVTGKPADDLKVVIDQVTVLKNSMAAKWTFDDGTTQQWEAANQVELSVKDGILIAKSLGNDPFISVPVQVAPGTYEVKVRARFDEGMQLMQYFWNTNEVPIVDPANTIGIGLTPEATQWQEYTNIITVKGTMDLFRIDPGVTEGNAEIDWVQLTRQ